MMLRAEFSLVERRMRARDLRATLAALRRSMARSLFLVGTLTSGFLAAFAAIGCGSDATSSSPGTSTGSAGQANVTAGTGGQSSVAAAGNAGALAGGGSGGSGGAG